MNVLILTEGGVKSGYGHISRCSALAQAFKDLKPKINVKLIVNADARARSFLQANLVGYLSTDWLNGPEKIEKLIDSETMIIIDSYKAPEAFFKRLRTSEFKPYVSVIDDYNRIRYEADSIINVSASNNRDAGYKINRNVRLLLGNEYIILRNGFSRKSNKKINKKIKNVLLTFGGADFYDLNVKVANLLKNQGFNLHIISPDRNLRNFARENGFNVYSNLSSRDMCSLMSKMDLCISGGGQTISELAYLGIPTIGICSSQDQSNNIKRWLKAGFLEYAGSNQNGIITKGLDRSLKIMQDVTKRQEKAKNGRRLVDGNGALRIARILLNDFYRKRLTLRKASINDAKDVYSLTNDPLVRKVSKVSQRLNWIDHLNWMENKLKDKDYAFYIVGDQNNFWGQVRFNIDRFKREALISISLHKDIRGLGLSSLVIDKAVKFFFSERKDIKFVRAIIRRNNLFSIKSFSKANFQFVRNLIVDGNSSKLFIRIKGKNV